MAYAGVGNVGARKGLRAVVVFASRMGGNAVSYADPLCPLPQLRIAAKLSWRAFFIAISRVCKEQNSLFIFQHILGINNYLVL